MAKSVIVLLDILLLIMKRFYYKQCDVLFALPICWSNHFFNQLVKRDNRRVSDLHEFSHSVADTYLHAYSLFTHIFKCFFFLIICYTSFVLFSGFLLEIHKFRIFCRCFCFIFFFANGLP